MATPRTTTLPISSTFEPKHQDVPPLGCSLKWRQGQLAIGAEQSTKQLDLPPLTSEQLLVNCLSHSPVKLIQIDPAIGEDCLKFWVNASEKAKKPVFLRLPRSLKMLKRQHSVSQKAKQLLDSSIAAILLLILSPVMMGIFCLLRMRSPEPVFQRQWYVNQSGQLFQLLTFRTTSINSRLLENQIKSVSTGLLRLQEKTHKNHTLEFWLHQFKLDKLPQLINVLWGEMSLNQPNSLTLEQVVRISLEERAKMSALSEFKESAKC